MAAGPKMSDSLFGYVHFGGRAVAWTTYGVLGAAENTRVPRHTGVFCMHASLFGTVAVGLPGVEHPSILQPQAGEASVGSQLTVLRVAAAAVDADAVFSVPDLHRCVDPVMAGGGVAEDDGDIRGHWIMFFKPPPDGEVGGCRVAWIGILRPQLLRCAVYQTVGVAPDLDLSAHRKGVEVFNDLAAGGLAEEFSVAMGHIAAVSIPVLQGGSVVGVVIHRMPKSPEHHIFMVAQKELRIGHGHQTAQDPQTARVTVDDIPQDEERVPGLQVDLLQNGSEPSLIAVDI